jgi:hypothetical protein
MLIVAEADDVANDVVYGVNERDVSSDGHVPVVSRSGRQLPAEVARHAVGVTFQVTVVRLAGLKPPLLLGREPIPLSQPCGRVLLVLAVPALRDLAVVVVELLLIVSILCRGASGEEKRNRECC